MTSGEALTHKICTLCKIDKPLDAFARQLNGRGGRATRCKACKAIYHKAYYTENKDVVNAKERARYAKNAEAVCAKQRIYYDVNAEAILARKRRWYQANREVVAEKAAVYRDANREAIRVKKRAYNKANKEKGAAYRRQWKIDNAERIKEVNRFWREQNKDKVNAASARHRVRKRTRVCECAIGDVRPVVLAMLDGRCAYCSKQATEVDHIVPVSKGGIHCLGNLLPACRWCNASKNANDLRTWYDGEIQEILDLLWSCPASV